MRPIVVRDAVEADLGGVAQLHLDAFPGSVLGELGLEAVRRSYLWQLTGPHNLTALVALDGQRIVGFIFGGVFRGSTIGFVKSQRWFLLSRVLRRPGILARSVGWNRVGLGLRLLMRRGGAPAPEEPDGVPRRSFGVLAIAVDPTRQGHGIGRVLMADATARAREQGFDAMHLSVHPTNTQALTFYRSIGWTELPEPDGGWVGRMTIQLDDSP